MAMSATIPVTVSPDAAARIAQLKIDDQVDRMIDYARQNFPELLRIEVVLNQRYDEEGEPGVAIEAYSRHAGDSANQIFWDLAGWVVAEFPPEVLEHLHLSYHPETPYAG